MEFQRINKIGLPIIIQNYMVRPIYDMKHTSHHPLFFGIFPVPPHTLQSSLCRMPYQCPFPSQLAQATVLESALGNQKISRYLAFWKD